MRILSSLAKRSYSSDCKYNYANKPLFSPFFSSLMGSVITYSLVRNDLNAIYRSLYEENQIIKEEIKLLNEKK